MIAMASASEEQQGGVEMQALHHPWMHIQAMQGHWPVQGAGGRGVHVLHHPCMYKLCKFTGQYKERGGGGCRCCITHACTGYARPLTSIQLLQLSW